MDWWGLMSIALQFRLVLGLSWEACRDLLRGDGLKELKKQSKIS